MSEKKEFKVPEESIKNYTVKGVINGKEITFIDMESYRRLEKAYEVLREALSLYCDTGKLNHAGQALQKAEELLNG
jgi:hypothetical protein